MGKTEYNTYDYVRKLFDTAHEVLKTHGYPHDIRDLCFNGPQEVLDLTENAQPGLYITSIAHAEVLQREQGLNPSAAVGHSLGEYAAATVAGGLGVEDGVRLVAERGYWMSEAGRQNPGRMTVINGLELKKVEELIGEREDPVVANHNSPQQIVISGSQERVELISDLAKAIVGERKVIELAVSVAGHSPYMSLAQEKLASFIANSGIKFGRPQLPLYSPTIIARVTSSEQIPQIFLAQLVGRVEWMKTIQKMRQDGFTHFIDVGPGKVVSGLIRRIDDNLERTDYESLISI